MDVIARLSSLEEAADLNLAEIIGTVNQPMGDLMEVDPLMGCAITLFPLIGKTASFIQSVRRTPTNSLSIVSDAMNLKEDLQQWQALDAMNFERPEDMTSEVQHSIQTAEAYRWAMLLYLHQAVPEIPMEPSEVLAKKVLMALASVPLSSRAIIVQIFPLLAAGCEVTAAEDRQWVSQRWNAMLLRLKIGNVLSCMDVVTEVWGRRDAYEAEKAERMMRRFHGRGIPNGDFLPPSHKQGKRKARTNESSTEEDFFGRLNEGRPEQDDRPQKAPRRVAFDAMGGTMPMMGPLPLASPGLPRQQSPVVVNQLEPDYTVRGRLHWLGVMQEWDWEGMFTIVSFVAWVSRLLSLGLPGICRYGSWYMSLGFLVYVARAPGLSRGLLDDVAGAVEFLLTCYAKQYFLDEDVLTDTGDDDLFFTLLLRLLETEGKSFQQNSGDFALLLP